MKTLFALLALGLSWDASAAIFRFEIDEAWPVGDGYRSFGDYRRDCEKRTSDLEAELKTFLQTTRRPGAERIESKAVAGRKRIGARRPRTMWKCEAVVKGVPAGLKAVKVVAARRKGRGARAECEADRRHLLAEDTIIAAGVNDFSLPFYPRCEASGLRLK